MDKISDSSGQAEGINYLDSTPVKITYKNGLITKVERTAKLSGNKKAIFIAPGLIDIQINGYSSISFSLEGANNSLSKSRDLSDDDVAKVTRGLWSTGVTSYFPTLTTNSHALLLNNISVIAGAIDSPANLGSIPGIHLEGPYISPVDGYRGAHPSEYVRTPDWNEFLEFYRAAHEKVLLITLAPEVEGAIGFIKKAREKGIVVSLGHHNGTASEIKRAIDNGANLSTHLGNGCANLVHRHQNPVWPQLADDRLTISIIADGFHLPPEILQVFYKTKGADKIILTSDITSYAGLPAGKYKIKSGETIEKTPSGNLRFSLTGGLYGSATPLFKGVAHIMKVTGCNLAQAIKMASTNPARLHNLNDRGSLEPGKRADMILFTFENSDIAIKETIVKGQTVFQQ